MNENEVKDLIGYISAGVDNRALSLATARVWADMLADVALDDAYAAVRAHVADPQVKYLDIKEIIRLVKIQTRQTTEAIEADVRSAKARGFIDESWPRRQALSAEVADRLRRAREDFRAEVVEAEQRALAEAEVTPEQSVLLGPIGRDVPHE